MTYEVYLQMSLNHHQYDMKDNSYTYKMDNDILQQLNAYKDRCVLFDPLLIFDQHVSNTVSKAYYVGIYAMQLLRIIPGLFCHFV